MAAEDFTWDWQWRRECWRIISRSRKYRLERCCGGWRSQVILHSSAAHLHKPTVPARYWCLQWRWSKADAILLLQITVKRHMLMSWIWRLDCVMHAKWTDALPCAFWSAALLALALARPSKVHYPPQSLCRHKTYL